MAKALINLWAEDGRNIIDDTTDSVVEFVNTGTGNAFKATNSGTGKGIVVSAAANIGIDVTETDGLQPAIKINSVIGAPTVAPLSVGLSVASGPALEFQGRAFVSALSGGSITGGVRVKVGNSYYWMPVMRELGGLGA